MRCLFVSNHFPYDPPTCVHGVFKRMGVFIEGLHQLVDEIDMLFFVPPRFDTSPDAVANMQEILRGMWGPKIHLRMFNHARNPKFESAWERYGAGIFDVYRQEDYFPMTGADQVGVLEQCLQSGYDFVFAHRLHSMLALMRVKQRMPPVFMDLDDIEHRAHFGRVLGFPRWPGERLRVLHTPALRSAELGAIRAAQSVFVCSNQDRDYLNKLAKSGNVFTIPNSIRIPAQPDEFTAQPNLMFMGAFTHRPNLQAADYLVEKIWPIIRATVADARLFIVGSEAERSKYFRAPPGGVSYLGFVEDLDALYKEIRIVCCPILSGAGTRIKIIEAAAHGKPIVSTTLGAEGLDLEKEVAIALRDDAESFAQTCLQLLADPERCTSMGMAARRDAMAKYDREAVMELFVEHVRTNLSGHVANGHSG